MKKYYPDKSIATPVLYDQMIGGRLKKAYNLNAYKNTCAVRMSYALNRSGLKLGEAPSNDGSPTGGDGYKYWIRVSDLKPFLVNRFKGADEELRLDPIPTSLAGDIEAMKPLYFARRKKAQAWLDTKLAGRKGIVVFGVAGWGDATGHFTLWDGSELAYAEEHDNPDNNRYYFWLTVPGEDEDTGEKFLAQVVSVKFWELK